MALGAGGPEAHFVLGRALMGQGRMVEAEPELREVIRANPTHLVAQSNLCELLWMRSGSVAIASAEIDAALRDHPGLSPLRISKARLLMAAEDPDGAIREIERGLAVTPDDPDLTLAATQTALGHDAERAVRYSRRAMQLMPGNPQALSAYGDALLAAGDAPQAIAVATELLRIQPDDGRGIALLASAGRIANDPRSRELFDYKNFVRTQLIDVPPGWKTLDDYLRELAEALHRLHPVSAHPVGQSLRGGSQLELDFENMGEPAIAAFAKAIHGPISRYMEALGHGSDPMRRRNTGRYR
ncbi:MAG TPA: tetratricopeptide repeat protein, partial [Rhodanobacteraceae bacterium]|nr:tetratricopeptide repeat protein [Rhodanobacteraceae bacterium]